MSAEDLAIDVGLVKDTDEFHTFVSCVTNILDYGCGYSDEMTKYIMEKCHTSELDIAKEVMDTKTTYRRKSRLKWWQTYISKRREDREPSPVRQSSRRRCGSSRESSRESSRGSSGGSSRESSRESSRGSSRGSSRQFERRPMDLSFKKSERRQRRPRESKSEKKSNRRRPMSPLFEQKERPYQNDNVNYERRQPYYNSSQYERHDMSSDVPRWPGTNNKKRRRYR